MAVGSKKVDIDPKAWLNAVIEFFKGFPKLPLFEQIAWSAIFLGIVFIILGLLL